MPVLNCFAGVTVTRVLIVSNVRLALRCVSLFWFDILDGDDICAYSVLNRDVLVLDENVE